MQLRIPFTIFLVLVLMLSLASFTPAFAATSTVFINEIHYDNTGSDTGESVEIAGPAGTNLTGWSLVLYNGSIATLYNTIALSGIIPDLGSGFGVINYSTIGLQNGSPDGIALVDSGNNVIQFLSYEGSFIAGDGPANGMTSTDIGVSEPFDTPVGYSLQLTGTGTTYEDFTWASSSMPDTFGLINTGQSFGDGTYSAVNIDECNENNDGTDIYASHIYCEAGECLVEVWLCGDLDDKAKYRLHFDTTESFFDEVVDCQTTSDDTAMYRPRSIAENDGKFTGPNTISTDIYGSSLNWVFSYEALGVGPGDYIAAWVDVHKKTIQDRSPDTDDSDGCAKPQNSGEVLEILIP